MAARRHVYEQMKARIATPLLLDMSMTFQQPEQI